MVSLDTCGNNSTVRLVDVYFGHNEEEIGEWNSVLTMTMRRGRQAVSLFFWKLTLSIVPLSGQTGNYGYRSPNKKPNKSF